MAANYSHKKQSSQFRKDIDGSAPESHKITKKNGIENPEIWEKLIWFYRTHLDIFIEDYFSTPEKPIKLFDVQKVVARNCGNCVDVKDVEARSLGKTWKMSLILSAMGILYENNRILVVSGTVKQAMITARYIETLANTNENLSREIILPIKISKDGAVITFKNNSTIECRAMNNDGSNLRGLREKIIYIDESFLVKTEVVQSVLMPILQYKRDIYWAKKDEGFEDFESRLFETSSAYLKSCDFYQRFKATLIGMKNGDKDKFACALNYKVGVRLGIISEKFVDDQKLLMPLSSWEMEWNAKMIGSQNGSFYPYDLTEPCRDLTHVEICQPRGSKSIYVLGLDVATSEAKTADNAALTIVKISEKTDGTYHKYLVYIRTYHGYGQQALATEVRKMCVRFPNISKIVVDFNAIGEGVVALLNFPYVDSDNVEHKPLIPDDIGYSGNTAIPIVRCFRGNNKLNNRTAAKMKLYFENKSLHLPSPSATMRREQEQEVIGLNDDKRKDKLKPSREILIEEVAVYTETDALQNECSNIIAKISAAGSTIYDSALTTQHKDRWSSLGMVLEYISQLEDTNRELYNNTSKNQCWGAAMSFN
ncbi:terminase family protein [Clostridium sp.]|uniref:terminase large subunit domain-containing protein n=1 Tax=Clostridium sp. TaxID=1506 RepID=UPI001A52AD5C|nr:terminase family protein [Clostridium sp.]MBK5239806.1 hypothetical protein [Clostridium sp.]